MIGIAGYKIDDVTATEQYLPKRLRTVEQAEAYLEEWLAGTDRKAFILDNTGIISVRTGNGQWRRAQPAPDAPLWNKVKAFETQYNMSSEEFLRAWNDGTMADTNDANAWASLLYYLNDDERAQPAPDAPGEG